MYAILSYTLLTVLLSLLIPGATKCVTFPRLCLVSVWHFRAEQHPRFLVVGRAQPTPRVGTGRKRGHDDEHGGHAVGVAQRRRGQIPTRGGRVSAWFLERLVYVHVCRDAADDTWGHGTKAAPR